MSYCRFENTYRDLMDCYNNINKQLSDREHSYRERLVQLCEDILEDYNPNCQMQDDEPEYDSAGFTEEDRIVDGQYQSNEDQVTLRRSDNQ